MSCHPSNNHKLAFLEAALTQRAKTGHLRTLKAITPKDAVSVVKNGKTLINFSSNDYLGLSKHPALIQTAQQYLSQYGTGATASRLVVGNYEIHQQLERKLANLCGKEAALLFNTGFQANATIIPALVDKHSFVLCDRLSHNSILQGILMSGARWMRYKHNNLEHLEVLLKKAVSQSYNRILIVTETVFSMEGDQSEVDSLIQLSQQYNTLLYLDDAHALGIMGKQGMGLTAHKAGIDISLGTFGKAFGCFGAFITASQLTCDYLINSCPGLIYTTALPPAILGAINAALDIIPTLDQEREYLSQQVTYLQHRLRNLGYVINPSSSPIIPVMVGHEKSALQLSQWLEDQGILATAIRPPTVPKNTSRIRFVLSSQHTTEHINYLIDVLKQWHEH